MMNQSRAQSFDEDLQWSVLDQDTLPDVLRMARDTWNVDARTAWKALQQKVADGVVRAYRATDPPTPIDLNQVSLADVAEDEMLFVAPAITTFAGSSFLQVDESTL